MVVGHGPAGRARQVRRWHEDHTWNPIFFKDRKSLRLQLPEGIIEGHADPQAPAPTETRVCQTVRCRRTSSYAGHLTTKHVGLNGWDAMIAQNNHSGAPHQAKARQDPPDEGRHQVDNADYGPMPVIGTWQGSGFGHAAFLWGNVCHPYCPPTQKVDPVSPSYGHLQQYVAARGLLALIPENPGTAEAYDSESLAHKRKTRLFYPAYRGFVPGFAVNKHPTNLLLIH